MLRIVLATTRPKAWRPFAAALTSNSEVHLDYVVSGAEALDSVRTSAPHLVIVDSDLPDRAPLDLVQKLITINAMVNTAVVSSLPDQEFHEVSEGLGVLIRLSEVPGRSEAGNLLHKLRMVLGEG
jgi:DNA-binding response OmpR family regulator